MASLSLVNRNSNISSEKTNERCNLKEDEKRNNYQIKSDLFNQNDIKITLNYSSSSKFNVNRSTNCTDEKVIADQSLSKKEETTSIIESNNRIYDDLTLISQEYDKVLYEEFGISVDSCKLNSSESNDNLSSMIDCSRSDTISEYRSEILESPSEIECDIGKQGLDDGDDDDNASYEYTAHSSKNSGNLFSRIFDCSIFLDCHGGSNLSSNNNKKSSKKSKSKKKSSSPRPLDSKNPNPSGSGTPKIEEIDFSEEFVSIMSSGINLQLASALGSSKAVSVETDGHQITWGLPKLKPIGSYPIKKITEICNGMPPKLVKVFTIGDINNSFSLYFGKETLFVTFIAPNPLERDALGSGFQSLISK